MTVDNIFSIGSGLILVLLFLAHIAGAVIFARRVYLGRNGITLALALHMLGIAAMLAVQLVVVWYAYNHNPEDYRLTVLSLTFASRAIVLATMINLISASYVEMQHEAGK